MTNYASGHTAEKYAVEFLKNQGYKVITTNWLNKYCEIDIIVRKKDTVHFIEVKYRLNDSQGTGFDYVTSRKLKQMRYAAQFWIQENNWQGDYCLGALELTGPDFLVTGFLPVLD